MTFDELIVLINLGVVTYDTLKKAGDLRSGKYIGAPGKEIFKLLPFLSNEQIKSAACLLANSYPNKPPKSHVEWAVCIRYIYGCFEKQGCLRSEKDKERMIREKANWQTSEIFIENMRKEFVNKNNKYGQILIYEMRGHRFGDEAIIYNKPTKLDIMLDNYLAAQKLAVQIKSWKHTFTPFFWAARYFSETKDARAIEYYKKTIDCMNKFCPDGREGYLTKAQIAVNYLKKNMNKKDFQEWSNLLSQCNNKYLKRWRINKWFRLKN